MVPELPKVAAPVDSNTDPEFVELPEIPLSNNTAPDPKLTLEPLVSVTDPPT